MISSTQATLNVDSNPRFRERSDVQGFLLTSILYSIQADCENDQYRSRLNPSKRHGKKTRGAASSNPSHRSSHSRGGKHSQGQEITMKSPSFPDHLRLDVPILFLGVHIIRFVAAHCMMRISCRNCLASNSARRQQRGPLKRTCERTCTALPPQHRVVGLTHCANTHITHYKWNFRTALYLYLYLYSSCA